MKKFSILNSEISFDEEIAKYAEIHLQSRKDINDFMTLYNIESKNEINSIEELTDYFRNIMNIVEKQKEDTLNNVMKILVQNKILDISKNDIKLKCEDVLIQYERYIERNVEVINKIIKLLNDTSNNIMKESLEIANDSVRGNYINILSNDLWSLAVADIMNLDEEQKVLKKKAKIYNNLAKEHLDKLVEVEQNAVKSQQKEIQQEFYKYIMVIIERLYLEGTMILIEQEKISSNIISNLEKRKASTMLENLKIIQDRKTREEQLIIAFITYPFLEETHLMLLKYIDKDIKEYIDIVKFLKCEELVCNMCLKEDSEEYLKILNELGKEKYLAEYLKNTVFNIKNINDVKEKMDKVKNVFGKDNKLIIEKENNILIQIIRGLENKYNTKYENNINSVDYEKISEFEKNSREAFIINNVSKNNIAIKYNKIFWVIFILWNIFLIMAKAPFEVYIMNVFFILIHCIVYNILKAIFSRKIK